jgi:hypothetical protein
MKKIILFRLVAVTFFCFSSLLIQNELSACKPKCKAKKVTSKIAQVKKETFNKPVFPQDGFFIKI